MCDVYVASADGSSDEQSLLRILRKSVELSRFCGEHMSRE